MNSLEWWNLENLINNMTIPSIFLTEESKKEYMKDFNQNVLTCDDEFWDLDEGLKELLIEINKNPNIQTLYSKRYNRAKTTFDYKSYIRFTYTEEVEEKLLKHIIPTWLMMYSNFRSSSNDTCIYRFDEPHENTNARDGAPSKFNLACLNNNQYFNVNTIDIQMNSYDFKCHDRFWNDVTEALKSLEA